MAVKQSYFIGFFHDYANSGYKSKLFFSPYKSVSDVLHRSATVITAPIVYAAGSAWFALRAAFELLKACQQSLLAVTGLGKYPGQNQLEAEYHFEESCINSRAAALIAVAAIASPFVNLTYLIGGAVGSMCTTKEPKIRSYEEYVSMFEEEDDWFIPTYNG